MKPCGKAQCRFFHDGRCYQLLPHGDSQPVTEGLMCDYSPLPHLQVPINETFLAHISSYDYRYPDNSYNDPYGYSYRNRTCTVEFQTAPYGNLRLEVSPELCKKMVSGDDFDRFEPFLLTLSRGPAVPSAAETKLTQVRAIVGDSSLTRYEIVNEIRKILAAK